MSARRGVRTTVAMCCFALLGAACGNDSDPDRGSDGTTVSSSKPIEAASTAVATAGTTITLVAYDSFAATDGLLEQFTAETGIKVKVLRNGDTGELVNKAILTKDAPLGDVLWGVDNTFLSRALDAKLFSPYEAKGLADLAPALAALAPNHDVTPVDYGDVCVNFDKKALAARNLPAPATLDELADPKYKGMLAIENPATSSPGLAFLLATVARYGEPGWKDFWARLATNKVKIVASWDLAYNAEFSGAGKGSRPLVVSYASSPPAAVLFGPDPKATEAPTGVVLDTCFRQVEFAGVLAGTKHEPEARRLIDFLIGTTFQQDMPLQMFVFPANTKAQLPDLFARFAAVTTQPLTLEPGAIAASRDRWIDEWTTIALS